MNTLEKEKQAFEFEPEEPPKTYRAKSLKYQNTIEKFLESGYHSIKIDIEKELEEAKEGEKIPKPQSIYASFRTLLKDYENIEAKQRGGNVYLVRNDLEEDEVEEKDSV